MRSQDDEWAELARQVPGGFGGLYFQRGSGREPGPLTIVLVDPAQREAALEALARLLPPRLVSAFPDVVIQQGRWDFAQLRDWQRYLFRHAFDEAGVITSADIDEVRNRLELGVRDEAARRRLSERLRQLDLPCFLVATEIRLPVRPAG